MMGKWNLRAFFAFPVVVAQPFTLGRAAPFTVREVLGRAIDPCAIRPLRGTPRFAKPRAQQRAVALFGRTVLLAYQG